MVQYNYIASDPKGTSVKGEIDADSELMALSKIEDLGLIPISVSKGNASHNNWLTNDISFLSGEVALDKQAALAKLLSTLFEAQLPVEKVLRIAADSVKQKKTRSFLKRALGVIEDGGSLEQSFAVPNSGLSPEFKTYVAIGDKTNALSETLMSASKLFKLRSETRAKVQTALIYPTILVLASLALISLMIFFLVPTLSPIFNSTQVDPPILFKLSEKISEIFSRYIIFILASMIALIAGLLAWRQTASGARFFSQLIFKLPLIGGITRTNQLAIDVKFLSMLLKSGETISASFSKIAGSGNYGPAAQVYAHIERELKEGESVGSVVSQTSIFPSEFKSFFKIAEETNRWPELMDSLTEVLQSKADRQRDRMLQILTPAITVFVGLLIGFLVYSILSSILQINDLALV
jgi:general secretion pathway protein F